MKIYVASSWRNPRQPAIVTALREAGHEVYDFRNPTPGNNGFGWKQCDPRPPSEWSVADYRRVLETPRAQEGFAFDMGALRACDACVLVLPCGRSAHLELGWAAGAGKRCLVLYETLDEPELMYLMCGAPSVICASVNEVVAALASAESTGGQIIDLMEALKASLGKPTAAQADAPAGESWIAWCSRCYDDPARLHLGEARGTNAECPHRAKEYP